jgi:hypothetical protein
METPKILLQIYASFFQGHASRFILMQAVGPFLVLTAVMAFIKPYSKRGEGDAEDVAKRFRWSYVSTHLLADLLDVSLRRIRGTHQAVQGLLTLPELPERDWQNVPMQIIHLLTAASDSWTGHV